MPQLDQMSFVSQVFWFIITFYSLYTFMLIYFLPAIFRLLKYRIKKFEILVNQINFLILNSQKNDEEYVLFFNKYLTANLSVLQTFKQDYYKTLLQNQKISYKNLELVSQNVLTQINFRKINL